MSGGEHGVQWHEHCSDMQDRTPCDIRAGAMRSMVWRVARSSLAMDTYNLYQYDR